MPCEAYEETISALIDEEASPSEQVRLRDHLAGCVPCRRYVEILKGFKSVSGAAPALAMPDDLRRRLIGEARRLQAAAQRPSIWNWKLVGYGAASALAFASLLLVYQAKNSSKDDVPLDVLLAAHNRYAMTMPLAGHEKVLADIPGKAEDDADD